VDGVVNGSMEFDTEHLTPTFKFLPGIPGSSYAVAIAQRLGLSDSVTARAAQLIDGSEKDITNLITELHQKRRGCARNSIKHAMTARIRSTRRGIGRKAGESRKSEKEFRREQLKKTEELIEQAGPSSI